MVLQHKKANYLNMFPIMFFLWFHSHHLQLANLCLVLWYLFCRDHWFTRCQVDVSRLTTKPTKWLCAQQWLRSAWASAQWVAKDPRFIHADREDSDQTGRMPRLIWVFTGRTVILLVLSWGGSFTSDPSKSMGWDSVSVVTPSYVFWDDSSLCRPLVDRLSIVFHSTSYICI